MWQCHAAAKFNRFPELLAKHSRVVGSGPGAVTRSQKQDPIPVVTCFSIEILAVGLLLCPRRTVIQLTLCNRAPCVEKTLKCPKVRTLIRLQLGYET